MTSDPGVVVVGAGPAGLSCAIVVAEAGLSVTVVDSGSLGGELFNVDVVRDLPGANDEVPGHEVASRLLEQADAAGVGIELATVESVRAAGGGGWTVATDAGDRDAAHLVLATGAEPRIPAALGDAVRFAGRGLSFCAVCDAPLYAGVDVTVVGDDDVALAEVDVVARHARRVDVLAPGDLGHVRAGWRRAALDHDNVQVHRAAKLATILGDEQVAGVRFDDADGAHELEVGGVFLALGRDPRSGFAAGVVETDSDGAVLPATGRAGPSLHAAGDVRAGSTESVAGAIADGVAAARAILTTNY